MVSRSPRRKLMMLCWALWYCSKSVKVQVAGRQVSSIFMILVAPNPIFGLVCDRNWKQRLPAMRLWGTTALCFFAILFLSLAPPTHARTAPSTNLSAQAQELGIAQPLRDGDSTSLHSAVAEKALNPTIKVITESYLLFLSGKISTWNSLLQVTNRGCTIACETADFRRWWCSRYTCCVWILSTSKFGQLELLKSVLIRNTGGLNVAGWWN